MFPILWRSLIGQYLKILVLSLGVFIALLLTLRLNEIAHFAAMGPEFALIVRFILLQIPYMLPIAVAVGSLIASATLLYKLSNAHEITALRSSGFSIKSILLPILLTSLFVSLGNFWIVSEYATKSHQETARIKNELRSLNPLLLLSHKHLAELKGFYFESFGSAKVGEKAEKALIAYYEKKSARMALFLAKTLQVTDKSMVGDNVSVFLPFKDKGKSAPTFLIENSDYYVVPKDAFSLFFGKNSFDMSNDHLKLPLLLSKLDLEKKELQKTNPLSQSEIKKAYFKCNSEITRRVSVAFAPFAFTLLGASFGLHVGRVRSYKSFVLMIIFTSLFLIGYFIAKGSEHNFYLSLALYTLPEMLMILASCLMIMKIEKGRT